MKLHILDVQLSTHSANQGVIPNAIVIGNRADKCSRQPAPMVPGIEDSDYYDDEPWIGPAGPGGRSIL